MEKPNQDFFCSDYVLSKGGKKEYLNYSKLNGTRPKWKKSGKIF